MTDRRIDEIVDDLLRVMPLMHRKLLRTELENADIAHHHLAILGMLVNCSSLPVSEIGRRLGISKSQMTHFIDKLISMELVVREPDDQDRRIVNICLSEKGKTEFHRYVCHIREHIARQMGALNDTELDDLTRSLHILRTLGEKLK